METGIYTQIVGYGLMIGFVIVVGRAIRQMVDPNSKKRRELREAWSWARPPAAPAVVLPPPTAADLYKRAARKRVQSGLEAVVAIVLVVGGFALAPFTGGASLIPMVIYGIIRNLPGVREDMDALDKDARDIEDEAWKLKRKEIAESDRVDAELRRAAAEQQRKELETEFASNDFVGRE